MVASELNIQTIFFPGSADKKDFENMKHYKPDHHLFGFNQLSSLQSCISHSLKYKSTPIKVGVIYVSQKRTLNDICSHGMFLSTPEVHFKYINHEVDFEIQERVDIIFSKYSEFHREIYGDPSDGRYEMLQKYCQEYDVILLDNPDLIRNVIYRSLTFNIQFNLDSIMKVFGEKIIIPKTVLLKASENISKDYVMEIMEKHEFTYPVVIKTDR